MCGLIQSGSVPHQPQADSQTPQDDLSGILHALASKIDVTLDDVAAAVTQLGEAFEELAGNAGGESPQTADTIRQSQHKALHALQFHDRLDQRMRHVALALQQVARLLATQDEERPAKCSALARQLRESCPVETDKQLFLEQHDQPSSRSCPTQASTHSSSDVEMF
ncbi:MAG: ElaB/YqjD/DUF883 family membrane-anchored ribosome-binding protein [Gammaproteobacteria bacterium]